MGAMIFPSDVNLPVREWTVTGAKAFSLTLLGQYVALL